MGDNMIHNLTFFIIMTLIGIIGSGIGGILGGIVRVNKDRNVSMIMDVTSGIMTGIVCFDMIPESIRMSNTWLVICGVVIGTIIILIIDLLVYNLSNKEIGKLTSIIIMLSMAIHNMIEGIAIGYSFSYSYALAINVMISMILHDIPEGMIVGITNKIDKFNIKSIVINSSLVGSFFGIGAILGRLIGDISNNNIAICLSIAAGAMLYVVACDLIPSSKKLLVSRFISIFYIIGIILSLIILFN